MIDEQINTLLFALNVGLLMVNVHQASQNNEVSRQNLESAEALALMSDIKRATKGDRAMRIALTGSSGTGKTTLAEWISTTYDFPINPVGSRSVAKAMGFASPYDVDVAGKRMEFQKRLLAEKTEWEDKHTSFVTDRTTLDNLVYTMLHAAHTVDSVMLEDAILAFRNYTHVIYCPVDTFCDVGSDPARVQSRTYHELYDYALWGLLDRHASSAGQDFTILYERPLETRKQRIREFLELDEKKKVL